MAARNKNLAVRGFDRPYAVAYPWELVPPRSLSLSLLRALSFSLSALGRQSGSGVWWFLARKRCSIQVNVYEFMWSCMFLFLFGPCALWRFRVKIHFAYLDQQTTIIKISRLLSHCCPELCALLLGYRSSSWRERSVAWESR